MFAWAALHLTRLLIALTKQVHMLHYFTSPLFLVQVFKEEEDAIKVDLHEGCGRTKLFWVMALADSQTLKAMVEFRDGGSGTGASGSRSTAAVAGTSHHPTAASSAICR